MKVLGVLFTRGVSLKQWIDSGLFDREVLIYEHHIRTGQFDEIVWFTYGISDASLAQELKVHGLLPKEIRVVPMPIFFSMFKRGASLIYTFMMPFTVRGELERCNIFKTNQMDGAIAGVLSALILKRPLYLRTGYTLSIFVNRIHRYNPLRRAFAWITEWISFRCCSASSVSSYFDRDYVIRRYTKQNQPPTVVGNYVDVKHFSPRPAITAKKRMIFVGRLSSQKNLEAAIYASVLAKVGLDIVGEGPDQKKLQALAKTLNADINWLGKLPNYHLPEILAQYRYFLLPALWEGLPKALLEAMSLGMICIGNNTLGINEIIKDGETGYLSSGPEVDKLVDVIRRAMSGDQTSIGVKARAFVCDNFSLDAVAIKERTIFSKLGISVIHQGTLD